MKVSNLVLPDDRWDDGIRMREDPYPLPRLDQVRLIPNQIDPRSGDTFEQGEPLGLFCGEEWKFVRNRIP